MIKAHVIKLNPTVKQRRLFAQACGCKRKAYNWAIIEWDKWYKNEQKPSAMSLVKQLNSIKKVEFPYFQDVSKSASQYAIWDLADAWKRYFTGLKDGTIEKGKASYIKNRLSRGLSINKDKLKDFGKPKFKKKGKSIDSFVAVDNKEAFKQKDGKIHIPRVGKVKCFENLRFEGKVNNVVVKRVANDWFAVVNIETVLNEALAPSENQVSVGVDLGIKSLAVLSDGKVFENPKALKSNLKQLKRLQRGLSRKEKGSNNRYAQQMRVAVKHQRITNIRKNALHQATTYIVNNYYSVVIEDLNVKGMSKNHKLAQAISDVSWSEFRRQLTYKLMWQGKELVVADKFYPSSKICSNCQNKKQILKLSERKYNCECCGFSIDRDLNASINLKNYSPIPKAGRSEACGELEVAIQIRSEKHEVYNKFEHFSQFKTI